MSDPTETAVMVVGQDERHHSSTLPFVNPGFGLAFPYCISPFTESYSAYGVFPTSQDLWDATSRQNFHQLTASPALLFSQPDGPNSSPPSSSSSSLIAANDCLSTPVDLPLEASDSRPTSFFAHYDSYPRSEPSTGPSKKRSRTAQACEKCRIRKAKCSGGHPCSRCIAKKLSCVYTATPHARSLASKPLPGLLDGQKSPSDTSEETRGGSEERKPGVKPRASAFPSLEGATSFGSAFGPTSALGLTLGPPDLPLEQSETWSSLWNGLTYSWTPDSPVPVVPWSEQEVYFGTGMWDSGTMYNSM